MAIVSRTSVSLRIIGDDLIPSDITDKLGCKPSSAFSKGDVHSYKNDGTPRLSKIGIWSLKAEKKKPGNLDIQIRELLNQLTMDLDVWKLISTKNKIDLFCGLFMENQMEGINISAQCLYEVGVRNIEIDFDIYGAE
jgi:hypothetical protein